MDRGIMAAQQAAAVAQIKESAASLAEKLGIQVPEQIGARHRDPGVQQTWQLNGLAMLLVDVDASLTKAGNKRKTAGRSAAEEGAE